MSDSGSENDFSGDEKDEVSLDDAAGSSPKRRRLRSLSRSRSRSVSLSDESDDESNGQVPEEASQTKEEIFGNDSDDDVRSEADQNDIQKIELSESEDDADQVVRSREEEEHQREEEVEDSGVCDFDLMMQKKKEQNRRHRKRKDIDLINDNDDAIARLIADMRQAARDDRELNIAEKPATKKIGLLPNVIKHLGKIDLQLAFIEANILAVLTDWLAPLEDKSLPHIKIRTFILKFLKDIRIDDHLRLKESGIGKAVMYLYRHPRESRENKDLAGKIIAKWARPIYNLSADYSSMTKRERQERDEEMAVRLGKRPLRKRTGSTAEEKAIRPGDPGWVGRARVPMVEGTKEYVIRPTWQSNADLDRVKKKELSLLEKHKLKFAEKRRANRNQHALSISIEGRHLKL